MPEHNKMSDETTPILVQVISNDDQPQLHVETEYSDKVQHLADDETLTEVIVNSNLEPYCSKFAFKIWYAYDGQCGARVLR